MSTIRIDTFLYPERQYVFREVLFDFVEQVLSFSTVLRKGACCGKSNEDAAGIQRAF